MVPCAGSEAQPSPRCCTGTPGSPEGAAGAPNGGSGLGSQPPHSGHVLPSAFKEKQFLLESLRRRDLPIPSPMAASQGNDSVTSCGIWCEFYISTL